MKYLSLGIAAVAFLLGACERHSWEDNDANGDGIIQESEKGTVRLYQGHGSHDGDEAHGKDKDKDH